MTAPALTFMASLRYDVVRRLWRRIGPVSRVYEVGAGRGAVGVRLARHAGEYVAYEPDAASAAVAAARFAAAGRGRAVNGLLGDGPADADVVCAFEVLEHIEDDLAALRAWAARLKPGGWLLLSVPAWADRFGPTDAYVGHFRRYDPDLLRERLVAAGLDPVEVRLYGWGLGHALEAARDAVVRRKKPAASTAERTAASGRFLQPPDAVGWLTAAAVAPFRLLQRARPDAGVGLVALARKPRLTPSFPVAHPTLSSVVIYRERRPGAAPRGGGGRGSRRGRGR
jgi:SAM-dependent methyltransferase